MSTPARREPRTFFDLFDMLETPLSTLRSSTGQAIRVEEFMRDDAYVVRAEIPGVDPEKNVEITITRGVLTVRAERQEEHEGRRHTEFRYGSYERHIRLPENVKEEEITASYENGILTVTVPLGEAKESARRIPIEH